MDRAAANIDSHEVQRQVSRILQSGVFKRSAILTRFLEFVVSETLKGRDETLKEYTIATHVLNKGTDFNPQLNGIVRIHANRLRKSLEAYYSQEGLSDAILITIPKGRYIPYFKKNQADKVPQESVRLPADEDLERKPRVGVLPFETFPKNKRVEVVCSVLCHDLTFELSKFSEIEVIANYSTQHAFLQNNDIEELVSDLDTDYLISGYCLKENDSIRMNIELNACLDHKLIWAESYYLNDLEGDWLQDYKRIVQKVVAMTCGFFGMIYRDTLNNHVPVNYDFLYAIYWHNRYHRQFTKEAFIETLKAVEIGLEKKPNDALLTALKAELYLNLVVMEPVLNADYIKIGTDLVKRAIGYDTACQHAYQVYAWSNLLNQDPVELHRSIQMCLSINRNNPMYLGQMGFAYICAGDYEKGVELMSESLDLSPYYPWNLNIGFSLYFLYNNDLEEALNWAEKINRRKFLWDPLIRASILGLLDRKDEARVALDELFTISPHFTENKSRVINAFMFDKTLTEKIDNGLRLAGLRHPVQ